MKIYLNPLKADWKDLCNRPSQNCPNTDTLVKDIYNQIERYGDEALIRYTKLFDKVSITQFKVTQNEIKTAPEMVSQEFKDAIKIAAQNIKTFHLTKKQKNSWITTTPGVSCKYISRPITNVGLYIPGGTAPLFSTLLMLGIPAKIAGCRKIVICTPPNRHGKIAPEILFTADYLGIKEIYKIGGIQAICSMAIGTASIAKVDKIFGPGNRYVTAAKNLVRFKGVAIDMNAGPSEVAILADSRSNVDFIAADILAQIEHDADSSAWLICNSLALIENIRNALASQLTKLNRQIVLNKSLQNVKFIQLETEKQDDFINLLAPEHLIICTQNSELRLKKIINAGSVFLGDYSPETAGDYASGTNHTLPTGGMAKSESGLSIDAFQKSISVQKINKKGLINLEKTLCTLANKEGLDAHAAAVTIRTELIRKTTQNKTLNEKYTVNSKEI